MIGRKPGVSKDTKAGSNKGLLNKLSSLEQTEDVDSWPCQISSGG